MFEDFPGCWKQASKWSNSWACEIKYKRNLWKMTAAGQIWPLYTSVVGCLWELTTLGVSKCGEDIWNYVSQTLFRRTFVSFQSEIISWRRDSLGEVSLLNTWAKQSSRVFFTLGLVIHSCAVEHKRSIICTQILLAGRNLSLGHLEISYELHFLMEHSLGILSRVPAHMKSECFLFSEFIAPILFFSW